MSETYSPSTIEQLKQKITEFRFDKPQLDLVLMHDLVKNIIVVFDNITYVDLTTNKIQKIKLLNSAGAIKKYYEKGDIETLGRMVVLYGLYNEV